MRKQIFLIINFALLFSSSYSQLDNSTISDLKGGRIRPDTSYVYWLPFEHGKKFLLIQGWESKMSHKDEVALDFKMKPGTGITAAREGIVYRIKKDSDVGGLKDEYLNKGNHVVIQHNDGSYAGYWHLQLNGVLVNVGDTVKKGQLIGYSGNTGYTAFPHLHFYVYKNGDDGFKTIPTRFATKYGISYLRPGESYISTHR
jgi:murein DD-endopeptidase MepM/ murein hydrolase activator NlpD